MSDDRRQHERYELQAQVGLGRGERNEMLAVINISAGGVLLRNDRNIEVTMGELVRVEFDVPELAPKFSVEGKIIRIIAPSAKAALFAAMWTSMDNEASRALGQLLWSLSQAR